MTWAEFAAARQVLAEERIGTAIRTAQRAEEAQVEATKAAIRKNMPKAEPVNADGTQGMGRMPGIGRGVD